MPRSSRSTRDKKVKSERSRFLMLFTVCCGQKFDKFSDDGINEKNIYEAPAIVTVVYPDIQDKNDDGHGNQVTILKTSKRRAPLPPTGPTPTETHGTLPPTGPTPTETRGTLPPTGPTPTKTHGTLPPTGPTPTETRGTLPPTGPTPTKTHGTLPPTGPTPTETRGTLLPTGPTPTETRGTLPPTGSTPTETHGTLPPTGPTPTETRGTLPLDEYGHTDTEDAGKYTSDTTNNEQGPAVSVTDVHLGIHTDEDLPENAAKEKEAEEYPDDLNPFGEDEEDQNGVAESKQEMPGRSIDDYPKDLNPFAEDEDETHGELQH